MEKVKPSMEFEGPLGKFWATDEVPTECLFEALEELIKELKRRSELRKE